MEFYSADIEMLMSGWNTRYIPISWEYWVCGNDLSHLRESDPEIVA
jgi:hypothetical protein